jgi:hypothetical protein
MHLLLLTILVLSQDVGPHRSTPDQVTYTVKPWSGSTVVADVRSGCEPFCRANQLLPPPSAVHA